MNRRDVPIQAVHVNRRTYLATGDLANWLRALALEARNPERRDAFAQLADVMDGWLAK